MHTYVHMRTQGCRFGTSLSQGGDSRGLILDTIKAHGLSMPATPQADDIKKLSNVRGLADKALAGTAVTHALTIV
jgi:hypothetical protein